MLTAYYDGKCVVCQSTCEVVRALDWRRRIKFVDIHDDAGLPMPGIELTDERLMGEIHVLDEAGGLYVGFEGTRRLLREVPLGLPLWLLLRAPGMDGLGGRLYRAVAKRRYGINRLLGVALPGCPDGSCQPAEKTNAAAD